MNQFKTVLAGYYPPQAPGKAQALCPENSRWRMHSLPWGTLARIKFWQRIAILCHLHSLQVALSSAKFACSPLSGLILMMHKSTDVARCSMYDQEMHVLLQNKLLCSMAWQAHTEIWGSEPLHTCTLVQGCAIVSKHELVLIYLAGPVVNSCRIWVMFQMHCF